jgi:lysophospholipase L1-like esterase
MLRVAATLSALAGACLAHDATMPINPALGVPGFPDCVNPSLDLANLSVEQAAQQLQCAQKDAPEATIKIGCVGDSITAGVHSSGGNHTYPGQLQILLDKESPGKYSVTNLGACGSTMMKGADSPYWKRPQYKALTSAKWDIIIIMLGTNDAKDAGSHGPHNWPHDCTGPDALKCSYAVDYASMIQLVKTLGTTAAGPKIYTAIPPPLMMDTVYGMNQTVINDVLPTLVPAINEANKLPSPSIDVFTALGGVKAWSTIYPKKGCTVNDTAIAKCPLFCDAQSCDQCHPDNNGCASLSLSVCLHAFVSSSGYYYFLFLPWLLSW